MNDDRDARGASEFEQSAAFELLWDALVSGRAAPSPESFDPAVLDASHRLLEFGLPVAIDSSRKRALLEDLMSDTAFPITVPLPGTNAPRPNGRLRAPDGGGSRAGLPRRQALRIGLNWAAAALLVALLLGLTALWSIPRNGPNRNGSVLTSPESSPQGNWPLYRGDAGRTGATDAPGPIDHPVERWLLALGAPVTAAPVVANGTAFVATEDGAIHAVDLENRQERWTITPSSPPKGSLGVAGDLVLALDQANTLSAYDQVTGESRWSVPGLGGVGPGPVIDGIIYGVTAGGDVFALDLATQQVRWRVSVGTGQSRQIAAADGRLFVAASDGRLTALDAGSGALLWEERNLFRYAVGTPATLGGLVFAYVLDGGEKLFYAFDAATGAIAWSEHATFDGFRPTALHRGLAYVSQSGGVINAVGLQDGSERFTFKIDGTILGGPIVAGELLYLTTDDGNLYAVDATTGAERWRFQIGATEFGPIVAAGTIYVVTEAGGLIAIGEAR